MSRNRALTAAAATALAAAVVALPASGQDQPDRRTLSFVSTEKQRDFKFVDARPRGESVGDRFTFSSTLHSSGRRAGRLEADCVAVDATYEGLQCNGAAILADGRLAFQGASLGKRVPGVGKVREEYVITGGSGAYEGVTGVMRRSGNGQRDTITFSLRYP